MVEQYDDPEDEPEPLSVDDLANLLADRDDGPEEGLELGEAPSDAEATFLTALADLEDDVYRTGRRLTTTDVERHCCICKRAGLGAVRL